MADIDPTRPMSLNELCDELGMPRPTEEDAREAVMDVLWSLKGDLAECQAALREARDENERLRGRVVALEGSWDEVARQRDEWIEIAQFNARAALEEGER